MMKPRLKGSKKWTAFPKEYSDQIKVVFKENFASYLENAELVIDGRIYPEEIMLRVGYLEKGRLTQANFEVSMNYSQDKKDAIARIHNCVDAAASMLLEYLEDIEEGHVDLPYDWKEVVFQGHKIFFQFNTVNSSLEAEANKLLGIDDDTMLVDEEEEEPDDALLRADEVIKTTIKDDEEEEDFDDEEDGDPSPRMFGAGKPKKKKGEMH